jgi:hypothetical protein
MRARRVFSALVLLVLYGALSLLNDPHGYLGTDTGGKVASLERMADEGTFDPDIGYWAEEWDPDGTYHPLYYTYHLGDRWVNLTTLPVVLAARPLYAVGGYRLALLLPMLGAVAVAWAGGALVRRLGGSETLAFWVIGLATPVAVYALDFWEHSIGLAFIAWGVVVAFDAFDDPRWWRGLLAGGLFGLAATTRTEAIVYGAFTLGAVCVLTLWRRRDRAGFLAALWFGGAAAIGAVIPVVGNLLLEIAVLGEPLRSTRAGGAADSAGGRLSLRIEEAITTTVNLHPSMETRFYLLGIASAALLAVLVRMAADPARRRVAMVVAALVGVIYLVRFSDGLGFVPGMLAATPLAVVGLVAGWERVEARRIWLLALLPLPAVWLFQFTGGAAPQWGGRYVLTSGFLLACLGLARLATEPQWLRNFVIVLSALVTAFGIGWLSDRSHDIAESGRWFADRPEPVMVTTIAHQAREYGAYYDEMTWLTAPFVEDRPGAIEVLRDAGVDEFGYIELDKQEPPPEFDGYELVGTEVHDFLSGVPVRVATYQAV